MAQAPTEQEIKKVQTQTESDVAKKIVAQEKKGKDFVLTGAGVIPEKVWKKMKS